LRESIVYLALWNRCWNRCFQCIFLDRRQSVLCC